MAAWFPSDAPGEDELSEKQIVDLAAAISSVDMELFAKKYLGMTKATIDNLKEDSRWSSQRFNDAVIHYWKDKNPDNQVKCLADLLYAAAHHHAVVDPHKVEEILCVPRHGLPSRRHKLLRPKSRGKSIRRRTSSLLLCCGRGQIANDEAEPPLPVEKEAIIQPSPESNEQIGENILLELAKELIDEIISEPTPEWQKETQEELLVAQDLTDELIDEVISEEIPEWQKESQQELQEFLDLADELRPHTEKAMKMEVAPWIQDYVKDMDDLYCELTLEKLENKPLGEETQELTSYQDIFETRGSVQREQSILQRICARLKKGWDLVVKSKRNTVLIKADPGMGKTTLGKRIAYDWARGVFTKVSFVLFVFLKLVNPGEAIENVIIAQNPVLEGMGVTPDRLGSILETFGSRCLLILDGMDEHVSNSNSDNINSDVINIIQGQKLLHCNFILTSRPRSTAKYEKDFDTIVRVDGFTESEARKFAMKILQDESLVENVLKFNPSGNKDSPLYSCPNLLSFICILVREEGLGSLDKDIDKGEIYARMVHCLYKKFTFRKGRNFVDKEFIKALVGVGKLAYEAMLSGKPLLKRSQVVREVGEDVFDYGLLIGNEDHRIVGTRDADIFITFSHISLQAVLGAFYYIWMLNEGHSIESLVGSVEEPFFMKNSLFLEFCVWFLFNSEFELFVLPGRDTALSAMSGYVAKRIDAEDLDIVKTKVPGPGIQAAFRDGNKLMIQFYEKVLEKCHKTRYLEIPKHVPADWVAICLEKEPSTVVTSLTLQRIKVSGTPTFSHVWPCLGTLYLKNCKRNSKYLKSLARAKTQGKLPDLKVLDLHENKYLSGKLPALFSHAWPGLEELNLNKCDLKPKDLMSLPQAKAEGKLPDLKVLNLHGNRQISGDLSTLLSHAWPGLEKLDLGRCGLEREYLMSLVRAKVEGKLPDLKFLDLNQNKQISGNISKLLGHAWPGLEKLGLSECYLKPEDLMSLVRAKAEGKLPDLMVLDLGDSGVRITDPDTGDIGDITSWETSKIFSNIHHDSRLKKQSSACTDVLPEEGPDILDFQPEPSPIKLNLSDYQMSSINVESLISARADLTDVNVSPKKLSANAKILFGNSELKQLCFENASVSQSQEVLAAIDEHKLPSLREVDLADYRQYAEFSQFNESAADNLERIRLSEIAACQLVLRLKRLGFRRLSVTISSKRVDTIFADSLPFLERLKLSNLRYDILGSVGQAKVEGKLPNLKVLKLCNSKISINLVTLVSHAWPGLEKLGLRHCQIKSQDLRDLCQAKAQGKLPNVKHLDLTQNREIAGNMLELVSLKWPGLSKLDVRDSCLKSKDLNHLGQAIASGKLPDLEILDIGKNIKVNVTDLCTHPDTGTHISWTIWLMTPIGDLNIPSASRRVLVINNQEHFLFYNSVHNELQNVIPSLVTLTEGVLRERCKIVEIIHGSAMSIQGEHSDVILHVPEGVYGTVLGNIHTDLWKYSHLVAENECFISPIPEYSFHGSKLPEGAMFRIIVPHTVQDVHSIGNGGITVKHRHNQVFSDNQPRFKVNSRMVEIFTESFSQIFIISPEKCCGGRAAMMAFSEMVPSDYGPMAKVGLYFGDVSHMYSDFRQNIAEKEGWSDLGEAEEIFLSNEDYDAFSSELSVKFKTHSQDIQRWEAYPDCILDQTWKLSEILDFLKEKHLCKSIPSKKRFQLISKEERHRYSLDLVLFDIKMVMAPMQPKLRATGEGHSDVMIYSDVRKPQLLTLSPKYDAENTSDGTKTDTKKELTNKMILLLARKFSKKSDLYDFAVIGLDVDDSVVDQSIKDNVDDFRSAVTSVIRTWANSKVNRMVAYYDMRSALCHKNVNLANYIRECLTD